MGRVLGCTLQEPNLLPHPKAAPLPRGSRDSLPLPHLQPFAQAHPVPLPGDGAGGLLVPPAPNPLPAVHGLTPRRVSIAGRQPLPIARPSWLPTRTHTSAPQPRCGTRGGRGTPIPGSCKPQSECWFFPTREPQRKSTLGRGGGCRQHRAKTHPSIATQP